MYCKYCGKEGETSVCPDCRKEKQKEYNKKAYEKVKKKRFNPDWIGFRIGVRKERIAKMEKEIVELTKRLKEGK